MEQNSRLKPATKHVIRCVAALACPKMAPTFSIGQTLNNVSALSTALSHPTSAEHFAWKCLDMTSLLLLKSKFHNTTRERAFCQSRIICAYFARACVGLATGTLLMCPRLALSTLNQFPHCCCTKGVHSNTSTMLYRDVAKSCWTDA